MDKSKNKYDQDSISSPLRLAEIFFALCLLLLFAFLANHQITDTGFFTSEFGTLHMVCLYVPLILGINAPLVRAWTGKRNTARPFEIFTSLTLAFGSLILVTTFPFDYSHLADTLPQPLQFVLAWVTDDIGRIVLTLQVVIGPITAMTTGWKYMSAQQQEMEAYFSRQAT